MFGLLLWSSCLVHMPALPNSGKAINEARRALAAGDISTAESICKQVLSYAPDHGSVWALLTETALLRDRPDAAIICANRAAALMPDDPIAHILRAKCLFLSGKTREAVGAAEAAFKNPGLFA